MATTSQNDNSAGDKHHSYSFTLVLSGFDDLTPELEHELFEVGCDDALLGIDAGTPYLTFDRQATSLEEAIKSAIKAVEALPARGCRLKSCASCSPTRKSLRTSTLTCASTGK